MLALWHTAARTTLGLFWMAFWAFALGYLVSSSIQVFVTRARMRRAMGETGPRSVGLGTVFGFISSSCSFAALATTRALFAKGAGLVPSLAFLLASTNLVIELGIVIAVFLSWQFVVGEYIGGLLLILLMWGLVRLTLSQRLVDEARKKAGGDQDDEDQDGDDWKALMTSREGWQRVGRRYLMEWQMVWKDVAIGFTVAGIIAAFVPRSFFQSLFVGASSSGDLAVWEVAGQSVIGPIAAFFTFIGSMGNIPLAAVLYGNGVSYAGIMAFIFSDLIVLPVLRIQAKYYGWKMALYIAGVFLAVLVVSAVILHYGFAAFDLLPDPSTARAVTDRELFAIDYTFYLNLAFALVSMVLVILGLRGRGQHHDHGKSGTTETVLAWLAVAGLAWIAIGMALPWLVPDAGTG